MLSISRFYKYCSKLSFYSPWKQWRRNSVRKDEQIHQSHIFRRCDTQLYSERCISTTVQLWCRSINQPKRCWVAVKTAFSFSGFLLFFFFSDMIFEPITNCQHWAYILIKTSMLDMFYANWKSANSVHELSNQSISVVKLRLVLGQKFGMTHICPSFQNFILLTSIEKKKKKHKKGLPLPGVYARIPFI